MGDEWREADETRFLRKRNSGRDQRGGVQKLLSMHSWPDGETNRDQASKDNMPKSQFVSPLKKPPLGALIPSRETPFFLVQKKSAAMSPMCT